MLPGEDTAYLRRLGCEWVEQPERGFTCVVIKGFRIPPGYHVDRSDLLVRLPPGFPDAAPDMWWFDPPLRISGGGAPPATDQTESYLGRTWQRWSRHFPSGTWRPGRSGLESYVSLIRKELLKWSSTSP